MQNPISTGPTKDQLSKAIGLSLSLLLVACGGDDRRPRRALSLKIVTDGLPEIHLGQSYDQKIGVRGGEPPYLFKISEGKLPDAIQLKEDTGQLFGLAATPGTSNFTVEVSDKTNTKVSKPLSIYIRPDPLQILTTRLTSGQEGVQYEAELSAQGGIPPRSWSLFDGGLPAGIRLSAEGQLSGTATEFGSFEFTLQVKDTETSTAKQSLQLYLLALSPMVSSQDIPKARQDQAYVNRLMAEGGMPPYRWRIQSGGLPSGIGLSEDGLMAGTPTVAGTFEFVVEVRDSTDRSGQAQFTLHVIEPLRITTTGLPAVIRNRVYQQQLAALGGVLPYQWSLRSGDLPPGLMLSESGLITGMTQSAGDYSFSVRVRDAEGSQKLALFALNVSDRFTYRVEPNLSFPLVCTSTHVSYAVVPIEVTESMQIDDISIEVDVSYRDTRRDVGEDNDRLKLVLFAPDGSPTPLCGNGAGIRGWRGCDGGGGIQTTYGSVTQPDRPLDTLRGYNPQGQWRFAAIVTKPSRLAGGSCNQSGTINSITLSIRDDRSPDDYIYARGFVKNNLAVEPWIRIGGSNRMNGELFLAATLYDVGPNGYPEGGRGDDLAQPAVLTWSLSNFQASNPNRHVRPPPSLFNSPWPTAIPPTITPDGHVVSGNAAGQGDLVASEPGGVSYTTRLLVFPPDWNVARRQF